MHNQWVITTSLVSATPGTIQPIALVTLPSDLSKRSVHPMACILSCAHCLLSAISLVSDQAQHDGFWINEYIAAIVNVTNTADSTELRSVFSCIHAYCSTSTLWKNRAPFLSRLRLSIQCATLSQLFDLLLAMAF